MDIRKLQRVIVDALEDVKAQRIEVFNTEEQSPLFERVIVASGTSNRQTKALAASVSDAVKSKFSIQPRIEGEENGEWIIVDCGAAVVHVMQPGIRDYYRLEEIWGVKPVRLKVATARAALPRASEDASDGAAPAARAVSPRKASAKASAGEKVAAKKAPAKRAPAKKAPAKKVATKTAATKKVAAKKVVTKKVVVGTGASSGTGKRRSAA